MIVPSAFGNRLGKGTRSPARSVRRGRAVMSTNARQKRLTALFCHRGNVVLESVPRMNTPFRVWAYGIFRRVVKRFYAGRGEKRAAVQAARDGGSLIPPDPNCSSFENEKGAATAAPAGKFVMKCSPGTVVLRNIHAAFGFRETTVFQQRNPHSRCLGKFKRTNLLIDNRA